MSQTRSMTKSRSQQIRVCYLLCKLLFFSVLAYHLTTNRFVYVEMELHCVGECNDIQILSKELNLNFSSVERIYPVVNLKVDMDFVPLEHTGTQFKHDIEKKLYDSFRDMVFGLRNVKRGCDKLEMNFSFCYEVPKNVAKGFKNYETQLIEYIQEALGAPVISKTVDNLGSIPEMSTCVCKHGKHVKAWLVQIQMDKSIDESADYQKGNDYYIELDEKLEFYNYNAKNKDVCYYISIDESGETHRLKKPWSILNFLNLSEATTRIAAIALFMQSISSFLQAVIKNNFVQKA